jgi:hypothetical protein
MRRLSVTVLLALVVLPTAALAARSTPGDGVFELRAASGTFTFSGRGVLWGQMDRGVMRVTAVDPASSGQLLVSGADHTRATDDPNVTVYSGTNLHFKVTGGKYKIRFKGGGVDLTAIGVGVADMAGTPLLVDSGDYALDSGKWTPVPLLEKLVAFGSQSSTPPPSGP